MPVQFEGFPRIVDREAMKPGRWFVAAEGARPLICFSTEEGGEAGERLVLTFGTTRPETLDFRGASEPLRDVWVAVRAALRSVLEAVTVADVAAGRLPDHVKELLESEDAWVSR